MSKKYRVKLLNERVVGPFVAEQIGELYSKGHLQGDEKCQVFPVGDWQTLLDFPDIKEIIVKLAKGEEVKRSDSSKTQTFARINKPKMDKVPAVVDPNFQEFSYKKQDASKVDYKALESQYQADEKDLKDIEEELGHEPTEVKDEEDGIEKTVILNRSQLQPVDVDKTVIVSGNPFAKAVKQDNFEEDKPNVEEEETEDEVVEEIEEEEQLNTDEATEFINLKEVMPDIKQISRDAEKEFEIKELDASELQEVVKTKAETKAEVLKEKETSKSKNKMKPVVAIAFFAILLVLLFPDDEKKKLDPIRVKINFPVQAEFLDSLKSEESLNEGLNLYKKGTYLSKIKASSKFSKSLHFKFKKNKSLGYLIMTYAEIFENSKSRRRSIKTIFKLIQIARSKLLTDSNVAVGSALFYFKIGKIHSANRILENFIRVNKPTVSIFTLYLRTLIEVGNYVEAKKVFKILIGVKKKNIKTYLSLITYYEENEERDRAQDLLLESRNKFPKSIPLLLKLAQYQFESENYKQFQKVLKSLNKLNSGRSPVYYSKFLEYTGILSAIKGKNEKAAQLFKLALKIHESDELRSKLSVLELGGTSNVEKIIIESKILDQMKKAKDAMNERRWEQAFISAIKASDMDRSYIPAQLLLGRIQVKRGYYKDAIKTFLRMKKEYPINKKINVQLVEAYIKAFKLNEAEIELRTISQSKLSKSYIFYSLQGKYYLRRKYFDNAIKKFKRSIKLNPINDADYFRLAGIYLQFRKFKAAKNMLTRSIALDPVNIEYQSMYANILYELEGAETAIGYLRNLLEENKDDPRILGDIAIYYYKNGQTLEFEEYKKRLERLGSTDPSFYEFLIYSAELDDREDDVIKYGRELVKINPGDLDVQIKLGSNLYDKGLYKESLQMFNEILNRLESFPRANYFLTKIYLKMGKLKEAMIAANKEVKLNPSLEFGYYALGEAYKAQKNFKDAEFNFKRSISKNGRYVEALMSMGWIKWKQGYLDQGREYYLKALKENQNNGEIHRALGYIYKDIGQSSLAIESFRVYLDLSPSAKDRRQIKALMKRLR